MTFLGQFCAYRQTRIGVLDVARAIDRDYCHSARASPSDLGPRNSISTCCRPSQRDGRYFSLSELPKSSTTSNPKTTL